MCQDTSRDTRTPLTTDEATLKLYENLVKSFPESQRYCLVLLERMPPLPYPQLPLWSFWRVVASNAASALNGATLLLLSPSQTGQNRSKRASNKPSPRVQWNGDLEVDVRLLDSDPPAQG
jgi:hypothetical protein